MPVLAKPGTAVTFDRRMWHCGTTNFSPIVRKVLFYGYSSPKDEDVPLMAWLEKYQSEIAAR